MSKEYLQQTGLPQTLSGERVIAIKSPKKLTAGERAKWEGFIDNNLVSYEKGNKAYNLGLVNTWATQGREKFPVLKELLEKDAEIEVDGFFGSFQFEKPFYDLQQGLRTVASSADQGAKIGQDQTHFYIYLSEKQAPGTILGTDIYYNEDQIRVVDCEQSDLSGTGWKTTVQLTNPNPEAYYPAYLLETGVKYTVVEHRSDEYGTQFMKAENPFNSGVGTIKAEFTLGGIRGVEGYVTGFADARKNLGGRDTIVKASDIKDTTITDMNGQVCNDVDPADLILFGAPDKNGKFNYDTARATTVMEYMVEQTLAKVTVRAHMWAKFGTMTDKNGAVQYINEGLWHQLRRGKIIEYPRKGGINRTHIAQAANYVYQNNPDLPWEQRKLKFKAGREAFNNLMELFQNEAQSLIQAYQNAFGSQFLFGDKGQLPSSPISGPLDALKMELIRFADVPIRNVAGSVTVEHDPALDYMPGQDFQLAGNNPRGAAWTTYSLVIWDVTDQNYTNNQYKLPEQAVNSEYNQNANLYLVRPEGNMTFKGRSNGRWDMGKASDIISSSKYIAQEFWAFNSSALWLRDPSKVVIIELSPSARRGNDGFLR